VLFPQKRPYKDCSEAELIARYQSTGDGACFAELFARYQDKVLPICFKLLRNKEESKDACMEIFEKARNGLRKDKVERFNVWFYIVIKNHCYDQIRKRKARLTIPLSAEEEVEEILWKKGRWARPEDDDDLDHRSQLHEVETALTKLDETQRTCLEAFYCQGKSYKEIAEETGYTLNQVKTYLQNGMRNLRIMLPRSRD